MKGILKAGFLIAAMFAASGLQAMPLVPLKSVDGGNVTLVQSVNPEMQIQQLQETIRDLNGRIEELNFQMLQMQEQLRKMQEDNEFRFQELEKGKSKSGALEKPAGQDNQVDTADADPSAGNDPAQDDIAIENQDLQQGTLGDLIFNSDGELVTSTRSEEDSDGTLPGVDVPEVVTSGADNAGAASEEDAYQAAYSLILSGDYSEAEASFTQYLDAYPEGTRAADAAFWLGEAQYSQGKYKDAAETFLNTYKAYGSAPKAPEVLLKLGMSLAALDNRSTACATLKEIPKRFPKASKAVITKVANEQSKLGC